MTTLYWVLGGGIAILFAGGTASGSWERIKKLMFRDFGGVLLKLYTLGNQQLEANLFKYIAMRPKKDSGLLLFNMLLCCVAIGVSVHSFEGLIDPKYVCAMWITGLVLLLVFIGHPYLKVLYCEFYTMRFDYYMALARPYLSDDQCHQYNARFASLESKQQHMELCDEVKLKGKQGKVLNSP